MEQILHQLSLLSDKDRRHVEKERERERRHAEKEQRRAERHRLREERRLFRAQRRSRGEQVSSSSSSDSDSSDGEHRRYPPGQGPGYSTFTPPGAGPGFPLMPNFAPGPPGFAPPPGPPPPQAFAPPSGPPPPAAQFRGSPQPQGPGFAPPQPPPTYTPPAHHIQLHTETPFPGQNVTGHPVAADVGGQPVFLGLVHLHGGLHPCKVIPQYSPPVHVSWGGAELCPSGPYVLVPFDDARMHWLRTRDGLVPSGARPVQGGYEEDGAQLYHALCSVNGVWVPGKTGHHLAGANAPFGNEEHHVREYQLLCWR